MVSYGNTVQTLDVCSMRVLLISAITDSNVFSWLIYSRNFLFIRQGILLKTIGMPEKLSCIYCSPGLIGPSNVIFTNHYLYGCSANHLGTGDYFPMRSCNGQKAKGINLRNFIVSLLFLCTECIWHRYPVVGHASLWIVTYTKRGREKVKLHNIVLLHAWQYLY